MSAKRNLFALFTVIALGVAGIASSAQAGSDRDEAGGYRIGPLGQSFGGSSEWGASGRYAYGFASPVRTHHPAQKKTRAR
jgi:hypothetical protein